MPRTRKAVLTLRSYLESTHRKLEMSHDSLEITLSFEDATNCLARLCFCLSKLYFNALCQAGIKHQAANAYFVHRRLEQIPKPLKRTVKSQRATLKLSNMRRCAFQVITRLQFKSFRNTKRWERDSHLHFKKFVFLRKKPAPQTSFSETWMGKLQIYNRRDGTNLPGCTYWCWSLDVCTTNPPGRSLL